jgi:hypothetical protein
MKIFHPAIVIDSNFLYILGGQASTILSPDIFLIDLKSLVTSSSNLEDCSTIIGKMIFLRTSHSSCIHFQKIYTLGGSDNNSLTDLVEVFDTISMESVLLCSMPFPVKLHSTCVAGDKIFVGGGYKAQGRYNENVFFYDLEDKKWTIGQEKNAIPAIRPVLIAFQEKFVVLFGGWLKDCKFNNKVNVLNAKSLTRKVLKGFNFVEMFWSWTVQQETLSLMDHRGDLHQVSWLKLKKEAEFELFYKKIWKRKKVFLFTLKFAEWKIPLPLYLIREISRFL